MEVYFTLRTQHKFYLLELGFMQDSITDKEISEDPIKGRNFIFSKTNDDDDCSLKNKSSDQSFSESQINIESRISPTSLLSIVSIRDTLKEKH
ncbi:jg3867 [Pararge aegeria aegeria]|uniref:Jg3867 protein n=1 Tax=Pararge aegeria aegeria TaxID=348720 RepID=A0A8S4S3R9_9NEOP|nr:jg3867 [Pararge aegeria aegeria]